MTRASNPRWLEANANRAWRERWLRHLPDEKLGEMEEPSRQNVANPLAGTLQRTRGPRVLREIERRNRLRWK